MPAIAILLTVYNRKETTLGALHLLHNIISKYDINFDIYMLDDACTDGTGEAVLQTFPNIKIIHGNGHLYWSGGMCKIWKIAMETDYYDYFLWFNDDAMLYDNAFEELFSPIKALGNDVIVSGAFEDDNGKTSYGGRDKKDNILNPNGSLQEIYLMNGNWVIIPKQVVEKIGLIDGIYTHSFGDWDYGCRAIKAGIKVLLTRNYVGKTNRHDNTPAPYDIKYSFKQRINFLSQPKYNPYYEFIFTKRHTNILKAIRKYIFPYLYAFCPLIYKIKQKIK